MDTSVWVEFFTQVGIGGVLIYVLMRGAMHFLDEQRDRDISRYEDRREREDQWFELVRSNSVHMATQNELLRQQNHLLSNVLTKLGLDAAREQRTDE